MTRRTDPPPVPGRGASWAFIRYVRRIARRHFAAVHWRIESARVNAGTPTLFIANHTNWWDGFLAYLTGHGLGKSFRVLMQADNLARYGFFRKVGALPITRGQPRQAWRDLESAAMAFAPGVGLWVFPQGTRRPAMEQTIRCERGPAHLALRVEGSLQICPVAFRYAYRGEQLPEAFAWLGIPWEVDRSLDPEALAWVMGEALTATVASLDRRLTTEDLTGFELLLSGRLSVNKRLDRVRHRLGLLEGPFEARNG